MPNYTVLIIDLDQMTHAEWMDLWKRKCTQYGAKIKTESYDKVTDAVDKIQDQELEGKNANIT